MKKKRIRIKDIAEAADVSRGTVDRVIHNRGKVAPQVKAKVEAAILSLGYSPNIIARTLANNKEYHIATLIPLPEDDIFWKLPQIGIQQAFEATRDFGIHIDQFYFKMDDPVSFVNESEKLVEARPDAVLMATQFYREAINFYRQIEKIDIPLVGINTHIKELDKVGYIGQNSYQSGVLAGKLFDISLHENVDILILHLGSSVSNAMHIMDKKRGLMDYNNNHNNKFGIINVEFREYRDLDKFGYFLSDVFSRETNIKGVFITNSRAHYFINALDRMGISNDLCTVGFDLIEKNCILLRKGEIDFLINQDPVRQGNLGIHTLVDQLLFNRSDATITYLPLDIVVAENLDLYLLSNTPSTSEIKTQIMAK